MDKEKFSLRLRQCMDLRHIKAVELSEITGIGKSAISQYLKGSFEPKQERTAKLAKALNVSVPYLMGYDVPSTPNYTSDECVNYPVIGDVAAGYGSFAQENETGDYEQIPLEWIKGHNKEDFFVLRVKGDSMYPEFKNGDHVLIRRCSSVDSGAVAVVIYNGDEATLKKVKYKQGEDWLDLVPINPEYTTKHIVNEDLEECHVLGEALKIVRHLK